MKKNFLQMAFIYFLFSSHLIGQADITVIATGLKNPVGIDSDLSGNFYVAQTGTGQNDAEISLLLHDETLLPFVVGLPSVFDTATGDVIGPFRAQPLENPYFVVYNALGVDSTGPAIFIFNADDWSPADPLTPADALATIPWGKQLRDLGYIDFDPYSMVNDGCDWYVADAAANAVIKRDGLTGLLSTFASFPPFQNPTPIGPPFVDIVPTRIINDPKGGFLVSSLTGFPFLPGESNVYHLDNDGQVDVIDSGLTLVADIAPHPTKPGFLTLKYADFDLSQAPPFVFNSSMIIHTLPGGVKDTLASNFGPSPGMALAGNTIIYATELFQGRILKIDLHTTAIGDPPHDDHKSGLTLYPNPANHNVVIFYSLDKADQVRMKLFDLSGKSVAQRDLGYRDAGSHKENISLDQILPTGLTSQSYYLRLEGNEGWSYDKVLIVTK